MRTSIPLWAWIAAVGVIAGLLAGDIVLHRNRDLAGVRVALVESAAWIAVSVCFGLVLGLTSGWGLSGQYFSGYLLEKSLSVDNVVVFALLLQAFRVPPAEQRRVLYWGVVGALALRGAFVAAGAAFVENVSWAFYPFGAIVLLAGLRMARGAPEIDIEHGRLVSTVRRFIPVTSAGADGRFVIRRQDGRRVATSLLLALVVIELTDVVFAADSIPAVFGVTTNVFVVFMSNAFAVLGLRSLYFVFAGAMDRTANLNKGLAVLLAFIGVKMLLRPVVEIPTSVTLAVIVGVVGITAALGLRTSGRRHTHSSRDLRL
jgi:tellurite resistance protein TerC